MNIEKGKKAPRLKVLKYVWMKIGGIWFSDVYITNKGDICFGDMFLVPGKFLSRKK